VKIRPSEGAFARSFTSSEYSGCLSVWTAYASDALNRDAAEAIRRSYK
jgi:hypothetical protein